MKKIVEEVNREGLEKFLGKRVTLFCINCIYTGKLMGINDTCVLLEDAGIIYETGPFKEKAWKDGQELLNSWYVMTRSIESFGIMK